MQNFLSIDMSSDTGVNSADEGSKGNRPTLAGKLSSSIKKTPPLNRGTQKPADELYVRMVDTERAETAAFEIIGQRLQIIVDKAKEARTTPRAVQTAVTEALEAFRRTKVARMERLLARSEWIETADQSKKALDTQGTNLDPNNTSQDRLLAEIRRIDARLIEQDHKISTLTENVTTKPQHRPAKTDSRNETEGRSGTTNNPWVEVAKRKPKTTPSTVRKKAPAVMVKTGNLTYVEALQKIRSEPTLKDLSKDIVSVRKTGAGHLLVEMGMGTTNVEMVNTAIKKAVGGTATVSTLKQSVRVGVFGLDEITTPEEVAQGFTIASGTETEVEVVLRELPRGQQMAIITTSAEAANRVAKLGRVRVGYTMCRVRLWHENKRCYRCLSTTHETRNCRGTDRSGCCMGCGKSGHLIKECNESEEVRATFRETILKEEAQLDLTTK